MIELTLPFPPSVNGYWRAIRRGNICTQILSKRGRQYKDAVAQAVGTKPMLEDRLKVCIELCAPDKRKRDIDNYVKAVLDSLTGCGVWVDDSQIDELNIKRGANLNCANVTIDIC